MASNDPSELDKVEREWQTTDDAFRKMIERGFDDLKESDKAYTRQQQQAGYTLPLRTIEEIIREAEERQMLQAEG